MSNKTVLKMKVNDNSYEPRKSYILLCKLPLRYHPGGGGGHSGKNLCYHACPEGFV